MQTNLSVSRSMCRGMSRASFAAILAASAVAGIANAQSTYQGPPSTATAPGTNQWSLPANWDAGVPNSVDAIAQVLYGINTEIEIDGNFTLGSLIANMGGAFSTTLPTKPTAFDPTKSLTFAVTSGMPSIDVQGNASSNIFFYNTLLGTQGIEKKGIGRLTFRFNTSDQSYTGDVKISGGVFGINQDRSLGAVTNNIYIGASGGPTTAQLLAEPASGTGAITLPSTRTINLIASGAQFQTSNPANDQRVSMVFDGPITDGAGSFGFAVTGGLVVTNAANTYDGVASVTSGALIAAKPESLPGYATAGRVSLNGGTAIVRVGAIDEWTTAQLDTLRANATIAGAAAVGVDTTNATGVVDWAGLTAAEAYSIAKAGAGTLRITGVNNYTGTRARIFGGTLALASGASLPSNITAIFFNSLVPTPPTLDLGGNTQTIAAISAATGAKSVVTNGSLIVKNSAANFSVNNGTTGTVVDLSGLTAFTLDTTLGSGATPDNGTRALLVQPATANVSTGIVNDLYFAGGSNKIKVNAVAVGPATGTSQGDKHVGRLFLGNTNDFYITGATAAFTLGGFNGKGAVAFQTGLTNPSIKLRGGTESVPAVLPLLKVGETSSGVRDGGGTLDLSAGTVDIFVTDLQIGRHIAGSDNPDNSIMSIGGGTLTATTLTMAEKVSGGNTTTGLHPTLSSTFTMANGTVTIPTVVMGKATIAGAGTISSNFPGPFNAKPTININGGTFLSSTISPWTGANSATFSEANSVRTINLSGTATLRNLNSTTDLSVSGIVSNEAVDNPLTTGNKIFIRVPLGTPTVYADANRKVTFTDTTVIADSGTATPTFGALRKAGPGGLQINGAITGGVPLQIDAGAVQVSNGTTAFNANVNARLIVDYTGATVLPAVVSNIVAGYNSGAWNGTTGFSSSSAAASTGPKLALGYAESSTVYGAGPTTVAGLTVDNTAVVVRATYAGDTNLDGVVDSTDFNALAAGYGVTSGGAWGTGDFDYDGKVNTNDFNLLAGSFGAAALPSALPGPSLGAVVPEPSTISMLAIGAMGLIRRRRR